MKFGQFDFFTLKINIKTYSSRFVYLATIFSFVCGEVSPDDYKTFLRNHI